MRQLVYLLLICGVLLVACRHPNDNRKLTVTKADGVVINDVQIATFTTPNGWTPNRSGGVTAVILTRVGANPKNPDELISIDIGKPVEPNAQSTANSFAAKYSGTVSPLPFQVDGEPAFRVSIPPTYEQIMPRECIVVYRGKKACLLIAGSKSSVDIWPALSAVAESWKWK